MAGLFDNIKVFAVKVVGYGNDSEASQNNHPATREDGWVVNIQQIAKSEAVDIREVRGSWML